MKSQSYRGTAYRQGTAKESPWIVSFVARAEEILDWAGIPRRTEDDEMAGFQRAYDDNRVDRAKKFFDIPVNQSPTALVIGFHPNLANASPTADLKFDDDDANNNIRSCVLTIHYPDPDDVDDPQIVRLIRQQIEKRVSDSEETEVPDADGGAEDEESDEEEAHDTGDLELGRSLLLKLSKRLDDAAWRAKNRDALLDLAKPATVIDGQHRLKGAERCERGIPFTVCALFNCAWAEQVFQFTVINYTQEGIQDQFITNNAALSLTQGELNQLQDRLVQAGVNVVEYELMKVVHFHDDSPFKDLVNLTERRNDALIGYKTMVRLSKTWFDARHPVFRHILPNIYTDLPKKSDQRRRITRWKKEDWGIFFLDFWRIVHETYQDKPSHVPEHKLWDVGYSQLIVAIVLFELQSAFFDALAQQDDEYFLPKATEPDAIKKEMREKVQKRVRKFLESFPAEFFTMKWGYSSLSIGPGRKALQDCFEKMVLQKGSFRYANSGLVTGQT